MVAWYGVVYIQDTHSALSRVEHSREGALRAGCPRPPRPRYEDTRLPDRMMAYPGGDMLGVRSWGLAYRSCNLLPQGVKQRVVPPLAARDQHDALGLGHHTHARFHSCTRGTRHRRVAGRPARTQPARDCFGGVFCGIECASAPGVSI